MIRINIDHAPAVRDYDHLVVVGPYGSRIAAEPTVGEVPGRLPSVHGYVIDVAARYRGQPSMHFDVHRPGNMDGVDASGPIPRNPPLASVHVIYKDEDMYLRWER